MADIIERYKELKDIGEFIDEKEFVKAVYEMVEQ